MLGARKFRCVVLAIALVLGVLPVRPLMLAFGAAGSAAQQCLLHGADCQCAAHCERTGRHSGEAQETAATPACHRDPAGPAPLARKVSTEAGGEVPAPAPECVMTSCGKQAPLLLTSQGLPCLAAGMAVEIYPDAAFEAVRIAHSLARFSIEASPPTPPPQS